MIGRKRVLIITKNDFRARMDGGSKRTAALVGALREDDWRVDWVAVKPFVWHTESAPPHDRIRRLTGALLTFSSVLKSPSLSSFKWFSPRAAGKIRELTESNDYDAVIIEHPQMASYMKAAHAPDAIVDMHNIESALLSNYGRSTRFSPRGLIAFVEARLMRRIERKLANGQRILVTVSDHDAAQLRTLAPKSPGTILVAPNGVDDEFFQVAGVPDDVVVFIGHLGWRPNVDAAIWLSGKVWPRLSRDDRQLRLHLIGRNPSAAVSALSQNDIQVFANVPSVIPHLATAACATAPLLAAGGTRIKILEALAAGVPVVSTSLGALGLEHLLSEHFVIADDPTAFADQVKQLSGLRFDREVIRAGVTKYRWSRTLSTIIDEVDRRYERRCELTP